MRESVAAVVVTYNRKELLIRCVNGLLGQTHPVDRIYIIDNASSDGTFELLERLGLTNNPIIEYVRLPENTGGAGGFHEGLKLAHKSGFQWIWLMDDDGCPDADSLGNLLSKKNISDFLSPVVLCDDESLSFPFDLPRRRAAAYSLKDVNAHAIDGCIVGVAFPFNGTLVSSKMVDKVGYPKKEMFIWGDELEYLARCKKAGFTPVTVCSAKHFHPPSRAKSAQLPFRLGWVTVPDDKFRLYLVVRNNSYINSRYPSIGSLKFFVKYLMYAAFNITRAPVIVVGIYDGLLANWKRARKLSKRF